MKFFESKKINCKLKDLYLLNDNEFLIFTKNNKKIENTKYIIQK